MLLALQAPIGNLALIILATILCLCLCLCLWLGTLIAGVFVVRRWPVVARFLFRLGCSMIGLPLLADGVKLVAGGGPPLLVVRMLQDWPGIYLPLLLSPFAAPRKINHRSNGRGVGWRGRAGTVNP